MVMCFTRLWGAWSARVDGFVECFMNAFLGSMFTCILTSLTRVILLDLTVLDLFGTVRLM